MNILDQLALWTRHEARLYRDHAWATETATALETLLAANRLLIEQYRAQDNFTLGGALTNEPFLAIAKVLDDE